LPVPFSIFINKVNVEDQSLHCRALPMTFICDFGTRLVLKPYEILPFLKQPESAGFWYWKLFKNVAGQIQFIKAA